MYVILKTNTDIKETMIARDIHDKYVWDNYDAAERRIKQLAENNNDEKHTIIYKTVDIETFIKTLIAHNKIKDIL